MTIVYCDEFNCKFNKQVFNKEARCIKLVIHHQIKILEPMICVEMEYN